MKLTSEDILKRSGFVDEASLTALVASDRAAGSEAVGGGSPAIISAISGAVGGTAALSAFITSSGACPTWACTGKC